MSRGRVSWFSEPLGYGFIETRRGDRLLVRASAIEANGSHDPLREGTEVEFKIRTRDDGVVEARKVTPLE